MFRLVNVRPRTFEQPQFAGYAWRVSDWDRGLVGDGPPELGEPGTFEQQQYGFRVGGPIVSDSIFYFVNLDFKTEDLPTGWSLSGNSGQCFGGCAPEVSAAATRFENLF